MRIFALLLALLSPVAAQAGIITIEPDDYAPGASLENPYPGVYLYDRRTWDPIVAKTWGGGTGSQSFGSFADLDNFYYNNDNLFTERVPQQHPHMSGSGLVVKLDDPTNFASIMGVSNSGLLEAYLNAYDRDGNKIQSVFLTRDNGGLFCDGPYNTSCTFRLEITSLSADIYYLMAGGTDSGRTFDHLQINQVPEPGTGALALLAAAGLALARRRRASV